MGIWMKRGVCWRFLTAGSGGSGCHMLVMGLCGVVDDL